MEPLAALSVATSVIQFVDFGGKLLAHTRQIYKSAEGVLSENVDIEVLTSDLLTLTIGLRRQLPENRPLTSPDKPKKFSSDDEALDILCKRCVDIAEKLLTRLRKLKVEPSQPSVTGDSNAADKPNLLPGSNPDLCNGTASKYTSHSINEMFNAATQRKNKEGLVNFEGSKSGTKLRQFRKWASFRKALEASWDRKEIEALARTLQEFKSEIEFRILVSFRGALKELAMQQSQTSEHLAQSTRLILDSFLNARDELANQLRLQAERLVQNTTHEGARNIREEAKERNILNGELDPVGMLYTPKDQNHRDTKASEDYLTEFRVADEIHLLMVESGILGSLAFPTLMDRRDGVEIAYPQTFEWVYEEPGTSVRPWSNFLTWLRHGKGIYWINGKAGSGKSTLMRYLYENQTTREELRNWSGSKPLEISAFFFWNSGDVEQRSQSGLLRSLIFEILQRHRELLRELMPDIWDTWSTRASCILSSKLPWASPLLPPEPKPWTLAQLKRIFRNLLASIGGVSNVVLLIDGLDEYDGDYEEIIDLFMEFSCSPNIKICVSSRPLVVFERSFAVLPSLKLQNLTHDDISTYVEGKLRTHTYMVELSQQHTVQVAHLIEEIVEKASGVFLWVKLVVKSLLHGLRDYNRISDLQNRVRSLPAELEALYAHMLWYTDPFYHEQAARIFQIFRTAQMRSANTVTLLNLSWADDEDDTLAENAPIRPISSQEISLRCRTMDARLKSVCAGLLESIDVQFSDIVPDAKVSFLHRTVSDFFAKRDVWEALVSHTRGSNFSPNLSMLKSCVLQLKTLAISQSTPLDMTVVFHALNYAKGAEADLNCGFPKLLDQLDAAASYQWRMRTASGVNEHDKNRAAYTSIVLEAPELHVSSQKISRPESEDWTVFKPHQLVVRFQPSGQTEGPSKSEEQISDTHQSTGGSSDDGENSDWDTNDEDDFDGTDSEAVISKDAGLMELDGQTFDGVASEAVDLRPFRFQSERFSDPRKRNLIRERHTRTRERSSRHESEIDIKMLLQQESPKSARKYDFERRGVYSAIKPTLDSFQGSKFDLEAGIFHHWSYGLEIPGIKPLGKAQTFFELATSFGLSHYGAMKLESGIIVDQDVNQHLLMHTLSSTLGKPGTRSKAPDVGLVEKYLGYGADPNISYSGNTPWKEAISAALSHFASVEPPSSGIQSPNNSKWKGTAQAWAKVFELFIRHGADLSVLSKRNWEMRGAPKMSPQQFIDNYFPETLEEEASKLKELLRERTDATWRKESLKGREIQPLSGILENKSVLHTAVLEEERTRKAQGIISWAFSWFRI